MIATGGTVLNLFRWPVKSMGGEPLATVRFDELGMVGDRALALAVDPARGETMVLTARRSRWLLQWSAGFDGRPDPTDPTDPLLVSPEGAVMNASTPGTLDRLSREEGSQVRILSDSGRHPDLPGHVHLTLEVSRLALCAELGTDVDIRRFRPNLHLGIDVEPYAEQSWIGRRISFESGLILEVKMSTERCAIPTNDPVTFQRSPELLRHLRKAHALRFGVYATVVRPATVGVGEGFRLPTR